MRAQKARTQIRQEQFARAAMKLLAVRGWQRVTLAAIARQVGVVTSAVYRHFQNKDEVLDAVLDLVGHSFQANIEAARQSSADPVAQLRQALLLHAGLIVSGVPVPRIILSEDVFTGSRRHRKRVHAIYEEYLTQIAGIIREGQRQRRLRRGLSAEALARMWLGLVQSPAILWLLGQGHFDLQAHCAEAWRLFEEAIRPGKTRMLRTAQTQTQGRVGLKRRE